MRHSLLDPPHPASIPVGKSLLRLHFSSQPCAVSWFSRIKIFFHHKERTSLSSVSLSWHVLCLSRFSPSVQCRSKTRAVKVPPEMCFLRQPCTVPVSAGLCGDTPLPSQLRSGDRPAVLRDQSWLLALWVWWWRSALIPSSFFFFSCLLEVTQRSQDLLETLLSQLWMFSVLIWSIKWNIHLWGISGLCGAELFLTK